MTKMVTQEHLVALREEHNPIHEEYPTKNSSLWCSDSQSGRKK